MASKRQLTTLRMGSQTESSSNYEAETPDNTSSDDTEAQRPRRPRISSLRKRNIRTTTSPAQGVDPETSSHAMPKITTIPISEEVRHKRPNAPLKSSMKHIPGTGETSTEATISDSRSPDHHRTSYSLRRVKTVEFKRFDATGMRTVPPLKLRSSDVILNPIEGDESHGDLTIRKQNSLRGDLLCSRPGFKNVLAEPALTKTDVHVVTRAPTSEVKVLPFEPGLGIATPKMQIKKSADHCREVAWDDLLDRKTAVASQVLPTVNPREKSGLEHIDSKLHEWNRDRGPELESCAPQVALFPDDEGYAHSVTFVADDVDNAAIRAPLNSQRTSGSPSFSISTPDTAWLLRPSPQYDPEPTGKLGINKSNDSGESMLVVPDPEAVPGTIATLADQFDNTLADHRLSNIDDSEVKFRGHRDSVTVARSRLLHNGAVSPELIQVKEYTLTAKKRMHARNRGLSEEAIVVRKTPARGLFTPLIYPFSTASSPATPAPGNSQSNIQ
ncbi:hypothetical protein PMIN06_003884 [Paraphaeosphaeria minitans]